MKRLERRDEGILDFIIRDYVQSASPVSSGRIFESGSVDASSATIRNVMSKLDGEGLLDKPHTSAGRVPTDKAYRYFVNYLMEPQKLSRRDQEDFEDMFEEMGKRRGELFEMLSRMLSEHMKLFTAVANFSHGRGAHRAMGYGLENVMKEPEFENRNLAYNLAGLMDNLDSVLEKYFEASDFGQAEVFIGEENPVQFAKSFSSFSVKFRNGRGGECLIFSVGPKRLDYEKVTAFINFAIEDIKKHGR